MAFRYVLDGYRDPDAAEPYPDLADLKGRSQRIKDLIAALVHEGNPQDAVYVRRNFKALKEARDEALAIAEEIVNVTQYWEGRN